MEKIEKFLKNPDKNVRFLDVTCCKSGCIGGIYLSRFSLEKRKQRVLAYLEKAEAETIPESRKGLVKRASGIRFRW